jgi:hypothetical protein
VVCGGSAVDAVDCTVSWFTDAATAPSTAVDAAGVMEVAMAGPSIPSDTTVL